MKLVLVRCGEKFSATHEDELTELLERIQEFSPHIFPRTFIGYEQGSARTSAAVFVAKNFDAVGQEQCIEHTEDTIARALAMALSVPLSATAAVLLVGDTLAQFLPARYAEARWRMCYPPIYIDVGAAILLDDVTSVVTIFGKPL